MNESMISVLMVEDNPGDVRLVQVMLQEASDSVLNPFTFALVHAGQLQEAVKLLTDTSFDVILLDLGLPDSQGLDTLSRIKQVAPLVPVIVTSGMSDIAVSRQAMQQGAQDYLVKGHVDAYSLSRAIPYAIERAQVRAHIEHLNRVLHAIRNVNQLIVQENDRERLSQRTCDLLVETRGFNGAWIVLLDELPEHITAAQVGFEAAAFATLVRRFREGGLPACCPMKAQDEILFVSDPRAVCQDCPLTYLQPNVSVITARLSHQGKDYGFLSVSVPAQFADSAEEMQVLQETAGDIGFALYSIETERQRQQAEAALQESMQRWEITFDAVADSVCVLDADWTVLQCNRASNEIFRTTNQAMVGRKCYELVHRTAEPLPKCPVHRMKETKQREIELLQEDNRWVQVTADPILDAEGNLTGIVHIVRDITYLKNVQEALQRYSEQLEDKVAARTHELEQAQAQLVQQERLATLGHLATALAHEMRNPLGAIKNAAYLLNMVLETPEADVQTALDVLNLEVDTAKKVVNNLLDFSNSTSPAYQYIDVNQMVRLALERAPLTPNIDVELALSADLPLLLADPRQIDQALDCLLLNAAQAMAPLGSNRDHRAHLGLATRSENEWIAIEIRDSGVGIPPENLERIFEPLFTTRAKGLGLGLASVRKIVTAHNGRVSVESQVEQGATFTLYLPVKNE